MNIKYLIKYLIIFGLIIMGSSYILIDARNISIQNEKEYQIKYPYSGLISNELWDQCIEMVPCGDGAGNWSCETYRSNNQTCYNVFIGAIEYSNHHVRAYNSDGIYHWEHN